MSNKNKMYNVRVKNGRDERKLKKLSKYKDSVIDVNKRHYHG